MDDGETDGGTGEGATGASPAGGRATLGRRRGDRGQVGVGLGLLVAVVAVGGALLVGALGGVVNDRARARTAADAAALAGVTGGRAAAAELAQANDGVLEGFTDLGTAVEATVRVGRARATSRAAPGVVAPP